MIPVLLIILTTRIVPYKEKEIEKRYYTIGEVADDLGVATSLIRFWESEFDIIKPKKNRKKCEAYLPLGKRKRLHPQWSKGIYKERCKRSSWKNRHARFLEKH